MIFFVNECFVMPFLLPRTVLEMKLKTNNFYKHLPNTSGVGRQILHVRTMKLMQMKCANEVHLTI